jgi:hypothetical protein
MELHQLPTPFPGKFALDQPHQGPVLENSLTNRVLSAICDGTVKLMLSTEHD